MILGTELEEACRENDARMRYRDEHRFVNKQGISIPYSGLHVEHTELTSPKAENIQKKHSKNVTFCLLCDWYPTRIQG